MADWLQGQTPSEYNTQGVTQYAQQQFAAGNMTPTQYHQFLANSLGSGGYSTLPSDVLNYSNTYQYDLPANYQMNPMSADGCAKARIAAAYRAQAADLISLKNQFPGAEATYIRWLISRKVNQLYQMADRVMGRVESAWGRAKQLEKMTPPMPDWLKDYIEKSMPAGTAQYTSAWEQQKKKEPFRKFFSGAFPKREEAYELRPLGAQAELSPEQMGLMAGYQAWGKAGSPYRYSGQALANMADWQRHWTGYTRLSESLFPSKVKLGAGWSTTKQR